MLTNIVFDIGNVLLNFKPETYLRQRYTDNPWIQRVYEAIFRSSEWLELDRGTMSEIDAVDSICCRHPELDEYIRLVMCDWYDLLTPIPGTVNILRELKNLGLRVYYLSNFHEAAFGAVVSRNDFFQLFDGGVASYVVRLLKPDTAIYERLILEYGISPSESLFVDDVIDNVKAAENMGFVSHLFTTPEEFRSELHRLNVI